MLCSSNNTLRSRDSDRCYRTAVVAALSLVYAKAQPPRILEVVSDLPSTPTDFAFTATAALARSQVTPWSGGQKSDSQSIGVRLHPRSYASDLCFAYALLMSAHHFETVPVSVRTEDAGDWRAKKPHPVLASLQAPMSQVWRNLHCSFKTFGAGD